MGEPSSRDVLEFLQALLAGAAVFDRDDPAHVERLEAACRLLEELQAITRVVPELAQSGSGLSRIEDTIVAEGESLSAKIGVLEGLREALEQHIGGMRRRAVARPPAAPAGAGVTWSSRCSRSSSSPIFQIHSELEREREYKGGAGAHLLHCQ